MAKNLQDQVLNALRRNKMQCTVHLTNGFQIKGRIQSFDNFVVLVYTTENKQMMIYKHAMSSVTPSETMNLAEMDAEAED